MSKHTEDRPAKDDPIVDTIGSERSVRAQNRSCQRSGRLPQPIPRCADDLARLAPLVEYPTAASLATAVACRAALAEAHPEAAAAVGRFVEWLANEPLEIQEEVYTRTFLVAASCVPYVSVHLFGDESFRRGRLMADLREAYCREGFEPGPELPDHVAVLLRFAPRLAPDELDDLVRFCLAPPAAKMAAGLGRTRNPYLHALEAVRLVLEAMVSEADPS